MILKLKQTPGIYLVGFMASGKTTVGSLLAERLGWTFVDVDADVEAEQGTTIAAIFDTRGESAFRVLETEAIRRRVQMVQEGTPLVVALGGGAFARPENVELTQQNGITVWLDCPLPVLWERASKTSERPLARDQKQFEDLYHARRESYRQADYHISTLGEEPETTVTAILSLPVF